VITAYEALRAYVESRGLSTVNLKRLREACYLFRQPRHSSELDSNQRAVARLLWSLGLAVIEPVEKGWRVRASRIAEKVLRGETTLITVRMARWTPVKVLIRYVASRGGQTTVDNVVRDLGGAVREAMKRALPFLRLAYRKVKPVVKPYNRHIVEALILTLGSELGLFETDARREEIALTDLSYELLEYRDVDIVRTAPRMPIILAAVAAIVTSSAHVRVVAPWIDPEVAKALIELSTRLTVVTRPPQIERTLKAKRKKEEAIEVLSQRGEVLVYPHLHTKLVAGQQALVTSANLTLYSLVRNIETGTYHYTVSPQLTSHIEEIIAASTRLG